MRVEASVSNFVLNPEVVGNVLDHTQQDLWSVRGSRSTRIADLQVSLEGSRFEFVAPRSTHTILDAVGSQSVASFETSLLTREGLCQDHFELER